MTTNEQIAWLTEKLNQVVAELMQTQEELRTTKGELQSTQEAVGAAQVKIAELEKVKTPPPAFVRATQKPEAEERNPRRKRAAQPNRAPTRSGPRHIAERRLVSRPDCHPHVVS